MITLMKSVSREPRPSFISMRIEPWYAGWWTIRVLRQKQSWRQFKCKLQTTNWKRQRTNVEDNFEETPVATRRHTTSTSSSLPQLEPRNLAQSNSEQSQKFSDTPLDFRFIFYILVHADSPVHHIHRLSDIAIPFDTWLHSIRLYQIKPLRLWKLWLDKVSCSGTDSRQKI